jgi:hypothetical protein
VPNAVSRFWNRLSREQKLSVGLFSVLGFVTLTLGVIQIRRNIVYPFTSSVDQLVTIKNMFGPSTAEKEAQAKKTDTDGDGLSDWDEEHVYATSLYLADTDSDGMADNVEIAKKTDPNCATGASCGYGYVPSDAGILSSTASTSSYNNGLVPDRNVTAIKTFLKSQGMTDDQLADYSDSALLEAYDKSVADFESSNSASSATSTTTFSSTSSSSGSVSGVDTTSEDDSEEYLDSQEGE